MMESGISHCFRGLDPGLLSLFFIFPSLLPRKLVLRPPRSRSACRSRFITWPPLRFLMSRPRASHGTTSLLAADCFSQREGDQELAYDERCQVTGGIVALGKFDALHIGHRELAIQAAKAGSPYLLSFVRMAEVLGWEPRAPVVAKCDRQRVLSTWAPYCGDEVPLEFNVEFSGVRHLTPRQFVEKLAKELRVSGVVAGENYRFGYRASGDASELVKLCVEYGLSVCIVKSVMDKKQASTNSTSKADDRRERGQVSSTRVRHALAAGDMQYVAELLGRPHRLVLIMSRACTMAGNRFFLPKMTMLNQPPKEGLYHDCGALAADAFLGPCQVIISEAGIQVELVDTVNPDASDIIRECQHLSIDFGKTR